MEASEKKRAVLLVSCPDQVGIVAALAGALSESQANILEADQHTDEREKCFFQRIRFEYGPAPGAGRRIEQSLELVAQRFSMRLRIAWEGERPRLAIFVSRYDHCLWDLLLRRRAGELDCEIPLVISNHPDLQSVAGQFGIRYEVFPITPENKHEQEAREIALLKELKIDLVVLARYMQILSSRFIESFPGSIINIHHSFLPAFKGKRPYQRAFERGVKLVGATAHYATTDLDEGPIIEQGVARSSHRDSLEDLIRRGRDLERTVLAGAVRAHLANRVLVHGNKTVVFT